MATGILQAGSGFAGTFSDKLTPTPGSMTQKRQHRIAMVEIGNNPARVKIHSLRRLLIEWKFQQSSPKCSDPIL